MASTAAISSASRDESRSIAFGLSALAPFVRDFPTAGPPSAFRLPFSLSETWWGGSLRVKLSGTIRLKGSHGFDALVNDVDVTEDRLLGENASPCGNPRAAIV